MKSDPFRTGDPYRDNEEVTIMIQYIDGTIGQRSRITNPWAYINEVKKNPKVKKAWIVEK